MFSFGWRTENLSVFFTDGFPSIKSFFHTFRSQPIGILLFTVDTGIFAVGTEGSIICSFYRFVSFFGYKYHNHINDRNEKENNQSGKQNFLNSFISFHSLLCISKGNSTNRRQLIGRKRLVVNPNFVHLSFKSPVVWRILRVSNNQEIAFFCKNYRFRFVVFVIDIKP